MYPDTQPISDLVSQIWAYAMLKHEYGSEGVHEVVAALESSTRDALERLKALPEDAAKKAKEPDDLAAIRALRPAGPRKIWTTLPDYTDRLEGALLARVSGCLLGAIVELWPIEKMRDWAKFIGDAFPPVDYWSQAQIPNHLRYSSYCYEYTRDKMNGAPVDDDIVYTLLGMLIAEDYGVNFTTEDVGKAWLKYLPIACTAEDVALKNLKKGIPASKTAEIDNPYCQWIGADIRSDPWAYIAPGYPEKAAEMAYRDAYLSHRRNGIYGEMFFSATQSAAFTVDNAVDALKIGLTEIPADCALHHDVMWALNEAKNIHNYEEARAAVDEHCKGMYSVHTNNNACLTIFGLTIGGNDVTKVISETVAMGSDNDCTAATAGSIVGAIVGKKGVPGHWYKNFNNTIRSYLTDEKGEHIVFQTDDVVRRFLSLAKQVER